MTSTAPDDVERLLADYTSGDLVKQGRAQAALLRMQPVDEHRAKVMEKVLDVIDSGDLLKSSIAAEIMARWASPEYAVDLAARLPSAGVWAVRGCERGQPGD